MDYASFRYRKTNTTKRVVEYENMNKSLRFFVKLAKPVVFFSFVGAFASLLFTLKFYFVPFAPFLFGITGFAIFFAYSLIVGYYTKYVNCHGRTIKESKHTLKTEEKFFI